MQTLSPPSQPATPVAEPPDLAPPSLRARLFPYALLVVAALSLSTCTA